MAVTLTGGTILDAVRSSGLTNTVASNSVTHTTGRTLIAITCGQPGYSGTPDGVSDDQSGTWTQRLSSTLTPTYWPEMKFYERTAGTKDTGMTVTGSFSANVGGPSLVLIEVQGTGLTVGAALDENSMDSSASAGTVDCSARTSGRAIIAAVIAGFAPTGATIDAPGGSWSEIYDNNSASFTSILSVQFHATGADTATFTLSTGTADFLCGALEIYETGGGGSGAVHKLAGQGGGLAGPGGLAGIGGGLVGFEKVGRFWERSKQIIRPRLVPVGANLVGA